jgi:hypothetical protein
MKWTTSRWRVAGVCAALLGWTLAGDVVRGEPETQEPQGQKIEKPALKTAVEKLTADYKELVKTGGEFPEAADYFKRSPAPDLTAEQVIAAMEKSVPGDTAQQAYVRWQLLSGIEGQVTDPKLAKRLLNLYRKSGAFERRPTLGRQEHAKYEQYLTKLGNPDEGQRQKIMAEVNKGLDDLTGPWKRKVTPLSLYRNELFARLPLEMDSLKMGYEDIAQRVEAGLDPGKDLTTRVVDATRNWALSGKAKPSELRAMANIVNQVAKLQSEDFLDELHVPSWREVKRLEWKRGRAKVDGERFSELARELVSLANNPGGGLKFKD